MSGRWVVLLAGATWFGAVALGPAGPSCLAVAGEAPQSAGPKGSAKPKPDTPWDFSQAPRPFAETCFDDFQGGPGGLSEKDARRWLEAVPDRRLEITGASGNPWGRAVTLKGLARLRAPWPPDAVLRLSLSSQGPWKLHFWSGPQGVTLVYYLVDGRPCWAAYRTTRHPVAPLVIDAVPHRSVDSGLALLSTDDRRAGRTVGGTCEIRHQDGSLVMTKGDVRLLTVPLETAPAEVYLEAPSLLLRDIAMARGGPAPEDPPCGHAPILRGDRPSLLPWREDPDGGGRLRRHVDGRITLAAGGADAPARASVPLMRPGLYEVDLEVEDPVPGTGIWLGDEQGRPLGGIEFLRDPRTGLTCFGYGTPAGAAATVDVDVNRAPAPFAGRRQWLRLVLFGGTLSCWTSGDGLHWGRALPPRAQGGSAGRVGLFCRPGQRPRAVTLRTLRVGELSGITSYVSPELVRRASVLGMARPGEGPLDLGAWRQRVFETTPEGTDPARWQDACAVAALVGGVEPPLGQSILEGLLRGAIDRPHVPAAARLRLLHDVLLSADASGSPWGELYERFCRCLARDAAPAELAEARRVLATLPLWTGGRWTEPLSDQSAQDQLAALTLAGRWPDVHRLCRQLRLWRQPPELYVGWPGGGGLLRALVDWLDVQAVGSLSKQPGRSRAEAKQDWRHPLIVSLDKDAYNTLGEVRGAVRDGLYADACRILASAPLAGESRLVSDADDPRRVPSLGVAVEGMLHDHPPLARAMQRAFDDVQQLRLRRVLAEADAPEIEELTVRYCGTPGAAEAYAWLGDRAMAAGEFTAAAARYRQAMAAAADAPREQLAARLRLAGAMLGRRVGAPATGPVRFGDVRLSAAQFERLVGEMLREHSGGAPQPAAGAKPKPAGEVAASDFAAPGATALEVKPWAAPEGDLGTGAEKATGGSGSADWAARQIAVAVAGPTMIVANRFQVWAFDLAGGPPKWTFALKGQQGPAHAWPRVAMRPCVRDGRVYVRLLPADSRPQLFCLDLQTGHLVWKYDCPGSVVSDPMATSDRVFALVAEGAEAQGTSQVRLASLDPRTGEALEPRPLVELREHWLGRHCCEATLSGETIVALAGGTTLCCDLMGRVRWIRQNPWLPTPLDLDWTRQRYQPPLVDGGRVFLAQPGVPGIECVELSGGRLLWQRAVPGVEGLLGVAGGKLLVETAGQIVALAADSGTVLWHHDTPDRLDGWLPAGPAGFVYTCLWPVGKKELCPMLVWCDVATGRATARWPLEALAGKAPRLGPLVASRGRTWAFVGQPTTTRAKVRAERDIVELVAAGEPLPGPDAFAEGDPGVDARLRAAVETWLPGWTLLSGEHDTRTGLLSPRTTEPRVLVTKAAATPARLVGRVKVPVGGHPQLLIELGHYPAKPSRVDVRVDGFTLLQAEVESGRGEEPWQRWQVDLSAYAGRTVHVAVVQHSPTGAAAYAWWKRLEVVPEKLPEPEAAEPAPKRQSR